MERNDGSIHTKRYTQHIGNWIHINNNGQKRLAINSLMVTSWLIGGELIMMVLECQQWEIRLNVNQHFKITR